MMSLRKVVVSPASVFKENGVEVPEGIEVKVVDQQGEHFTLPPRPNEDEIFDEQLQNVVGGTDCVVNPGPLPYNGDDGGAW